MPGSAWVGSGARARSGEKNDEKKEQDTSAWRSWGQVGCVHSDRVEPITTSNLEARCVLLCTAQGKEVSLSW